MTAKWVDTDMARALAERDTLRQHNAVLQAECQAGRVASDLAAAVRLKQARAEDAYNARRDYCIAKAATDAAGAMGEVGRG